MITHTLNPGELIREISDIFTAKGIQIPCMPRRSRSRPHAYRTNSPQVSENDPVPFAPHIPRSYIIRTRHSNQFLPVKVVSYQSSVVSKNTYSTILLLQQPDIKPL